MVYLSENMQLDLFGENKRTKSETSLVQNWFEIMSESEMFHQSYIHYHWPGVVTCPYQVSNVGVQ